MKQKLKEIESILDDTDNWSAESELKVERTAKDLLLMNLKDQMELLDKYGDKDKAPTTNKLHDLRIQIIELEEELKNL